MATHWETSLQAGYVTLGSIPEWSGGDITRIIAGEAA
jgi:hypothetical protein